jgi:hypothetical protein
VPADFAYLQQLSSNLSYLGPVSAHAIIQLCVHLLSILCALPVLHLRMPVILMQHSHLAVHTLLGGWAPGLPGAKGSSHPFRGQGGHNTLRGTLDDKDRRVAVVVHTQASQPVCASHRGSKSPGSWFVTLLSFDAAIAVHAIATELLCMNCFPLGLSRA